MPGIEYWALPLIVAYTYAAVLPTWLAARIAWALMMRDLRRATQ